MVLVDKSHEVSGDVAALVIVSIVGDGTVTDVGIFTGATVVGAAATGVRTAGARAGAGADCCTLVCCCTTMLTTGATRLPMRSAMPPKKLGTEIEGAEKLVRSAAPNPPPELTEEENDGVERTALVIPPPPEKVLGALLIVRAPEANPVLGAEADNPPVVGCSEAVEPCGKLEPEEPEESEPFDCCTGAVLKPVG